MCLSAGSQQAWSKPAFGDFGGGSATSCERSWRAPAALARGESPCSQRLAVCGTLLLHLRDVAKKEGLEVGGKTESHEERRTRLELSLVSPLQQTWRWLYPC